jgi:hypothetical protein
VQARSLGQVGHKIIAKQLDGISAAVLRRGAGELADPALAAALRRLADQASEGASESQKEPLEGVKKQRAE